MADKIDGKPNQAAQLPSMEMQLVRDQRYSSGSMFFSFSDTTAVVSDSETGEKLGEVVGVVGGGIEINDSRTQQAWIITAQEIWNAHTTWKETHTAE